MPSLLETLNQTPPFWAYALARKRTNPPRRYTLREISERSELPFRTTVRIAAKLSWGNTKISHASAFLSACDVDLKHLHRHKEFVRNVLDNGGVFSHLTPKQRRTLNLNVERAAAIKAQETA